MDTLLLSSFVLHAIHIMTLTNLEVATHLCLAIFLCTTFTAAHIILSLSLSLLSMHRADGRMVVVGKLVANIFLFLSLSPHKALSSRSMYLRYEILVENSALQLFSCSFTGA
jgi:hypothetical protein